MITPKQALTHYGDPRSQKSLALFDVPAALEVGELPHKVYCNKDMVAPLNKALGLIVARGLAPLVKTWNGCFCLRQMRGSKAWSLHSWGLGVDINAADNPMGHKPTLDPRVVACFKEAGFDWGGDWASPDGMHFQLARLP